MKIEISESLVLSYLRHVQSCWLVQTNWKASAKWPKEKEMSDGKLDKLFVVRCSPFLQLSKEWGAPQKLLSKDSCQRELALKISYAGLVESEEHPGKRYWKQPFGKFYGCSQWSRQDHLHNAKSFLEWLNTLPDPDEALTTQKRTFQDYIRSVEGRAHPNEQLGA